MIAFRNENENTNIEHSFLKVASHVKDRLHNGFFEFTTEILFFQWYSINKNLRQFPQSGSFIKCYCFL